MIESGKTSKPGIEECKPLLDACTPEVYRFNAFRITGLAVEATVRDIKRRIDDLKHAEEMGDAEEEHSHAFALKQLPSLDQIREAALRLQDPERRMVEEFFWFWPMQWGSGKTDKALQSLSSGNKDKAHKIWVKALSDENPDQTIISKHNLAVSYQMSALDGEFISVRKNLTEESLARVEKYWQTSFVWWEELADSESFWSLVSARIRMLDDPRLTTGFARRMRATLPEALDMINAKLALAYIEKDKLDLARKHIVFMYETHQGLDNVPKTLAMVTDPLKVRIRNAIDKANDTTVEKPDKAAEAAHDLLIAVREPLDIIKEILPSGNAERIDLCDAVAEAALRAVNRFLNDGGDLEEGIAILKSAHAIAESKDVRADIAEIMSEAKSAALLKPIREACEKALEMAQERPENGLRIAEDFLLATEHQRCQIEQSDETGVLRDHVRKEIATTVMQCAVLLANETGEWKDCINLLKESLSLSTDQDLSAHISVNLATATRNARAQESLEARLPQERNASSNKGCIIFFVVAIAFITLWNFFGDDSSENNSAGQPPARTTREIAVPQRSTLSTEIEAGKMSARQMESQIANMDDQLESLQGKMNSYRLGNNVDEYNRLVNEFNSYVYRRNALYAQYERLIDEVNRKVDRFNSGSR